MIATEVAVWVGIAVAGAVGFVVGILLMLAWERFSDPRVRNIAHVYGTTGIPTSRFDDISRGRGAALVQRWLALSSKPSTRVALIPTSPKLEPIARQAAEWLSALHDQAAPLVEGAGDGLGGQEPGVPDQTTQSPDDGLAVEPAAATGATMPPAGETNWRRWHRPQRSSPETESEDTAPFEGHAAEAVDESVLAPAERLVLVASSLSDPESAPEAEALRSDVIVLLVQADTRSKDLIESAGTFEHFGHRPEWILLVDSVRKSRRRMKRAASA